MHVLLEVVAGGSFVVMVLVKLQLGLLLNLDSGHEQVALPRLAVKGRTLTTTFTCSSFYPSVGFIWWLKFKLLTHSTLKAERNIPLLMPDYHLRC